MLLRDPDLADPEDWPVLFAKILSALETAAGLPNLGQTFTKAQFKDGLYTVLLLETSHPNFSLDCTKYICAYLNNNDEDSIQTIAKALIKTVPKQFLISTNFRHLLRAASNLKIPFTILNETDVLLGWGRRSRIMHSSSTERTSGLSIKLARDKYKTCKFLKHCDIPVPVQRNVRNLGEALVAAREIGFPIVVKPRSSDGGAGVTTNISSTIDIEQAFNLAAAEGGGVLVERYVLGREYRLLVVNGKLLSCHERIPARVIGNGKDTISSLIAQENERRRQVRKNAFSDIPISIGNDTAFCLERQGLHLEAIPTNGTAVRVRMVPKVQTGGEVEVVNIASVSPQLRQDVEKAARMMRLDIAGIDAISVTQSHPYSGTKWVITEVNAIPQINRFKELEIHDAFLKAAAPNAGRVASLLMTDTSLQGVAQLQAILAAARSKGIGVGLKVENEEQERKFAGKALVVTRQQKMLSIIGDQKVDCIIALQKPEDIFQNGLILPYFDGVLLSATQNDDLQQIISHTLFQHNLGEIIYQESTLDLDRFRQVYEQNRLKSYSSQNEVVKLAISILEQKALAEQSASVPTDY